MNETFWQRYKRTYQGLPSEAWILAGVNLINASGTMVVFFMTLYLTQRLGFTAARAGQVVGTFGVGMLLGTVLGGKLADRVGTRAVQKASLIASGAFLIVLGFERHVPLLFVLVFLSGVSNAALFPANASAMAEICGPSDRSRGFVLNRLANNLGATIGPVVGGLLARLDYRFLFWGDGLTSLIAALALFVFLPKVHKRTESTGRNSTPPATSWKKDGVFWRLLLCSFGSTLIFSQLYGALPLYLHSAYRLPVNLIGFAIAINPLMIVLVQMVVTHGVERFPKARVAAAGTLFLAAGYAVLPFGQGFAYSVFAIAVWTIGEMLFMPTQLTMVSFRAPEGSQGTYQGLNSLAFGLGIVFGATLGTQILEKAGPSTLWFGVGGLGLIVAATYLRLNRNYEAALHPAAIASGKEQGGGP